MRAKVEEHGVVVRSVGVKDVILPGEMKTILNRVVEAEKIAQANLIKRREETAATRSLLNTGRLMDENPTLLRLKEAARPPAKLTTRRTVLTTGTPVTQRATMTNLPPSSLGLSLIMMATGVGIPIMAALNGGLGARIGSPWLAAFILFLMGAVISGIVLAFMGLPPHLNLTAPPMFFMGGFLVAFYVLSVTWIAPRIGVGNAIFFVLLGQIASAAAIDQFGLFGAPEFPTTMRRWIGIGFMAVGVFLARRI